MSEFKLTRRPGMLLPEEVIALQAERDALKARCADLEALTLTQEERIEQEVHSSHAAMNERDALHAQVAMLREALEAVEYFGPADGTHGACLECGQSDILEHKPECQVGYYIRRKLAATADAGAWLDTEREKATLFAMRQAMILVCPLCHAGVPYTGLAHKIEGRGHNVEACSAASIHAAINARSEAPDA